MDDISQIAAAIEENSKAVRAELTKRDERLAEIEARLLGYGDSSPGLGRKSQPPAPAAQPRAHEKEAADHLQTFNAWLRAPRDGDLRAQLNRQERTIFAIATVGSDAAGGHLVPSLVAGTLAEQVRDMSPMRMYANVQAVSVSDIKFPLSRNNAGQGWVGEGGTRSATTEPLLHAAVPAFGINYAYVSASEELLLDSQFDIGTWFSTSAANAIAETEGQAFVSGDASAKPRGFLTTTPTLVEDFATPTPRTYPALQYIRSGVADGFGALDLDTPFYPADAFMDTVYTLKSQYRERAVWMMNSSTAAVVRKFKDGDGRFLWSDPISAGQPATLLGYPVVTNEQMPDIEANAFPVAFGDFGRGYLICDQMGIRVDVDNHITAPGTVKWYIRRRVGGTTYDHHAIKLIKCEAPG